MSKKKEPQPQSTEADIENSQVDDVSLDSSDNEADIEAESQQQDALAVAEQEIAKLKDAFLRAKAEEENIRRRAEKDVANSRKFAIEGFAKELLNVFDSLTLATATELAENADDAVKSIHEGAQITLKQLNTAFAKFALTEIAPEVGEKLDPNRHQAMSMVETDQVESGCILNVIQSGFELHERLLRPAMVVVAK